MEGVQKSFSSRVLWIAIFLCTIYQSYRYPLQINSTGTSPTYSDTPPILQMGKFILALPLLMIALVRWVSGTALIVRTPLVLGSLVLASISLLKLFSSYDSRYLDVSFWLVFALVLALAVDRVEISDIDRFFYFLMVYSLGSTLIEVILFVTVGRLPALAYEGTFLVRFGGFLDDPNGFAAILFLLMGWSHARFKGRVRFFLLASLVICLLLTQSWTAFAFFLVLVTFWGLVAVVKRPFLVAGALGLVLLAFLLMPTPTQFPLMNFMEEMLKAKQGSIEGHSFVWSTWVSRWDQWALFGDAIYNPYESWWAGSLVNFGVPWFLIYAGLVTALTISLGRAFRACNFEARPVYKGLLLFGLYFVIGSLNLPFPVIFPINALFFLFAFLVAFGKVTDDCHVAGQVKVRPPRVPCEASTK